MAMKAIPLPDCSYEISANQTDARAETKRLINLFAEALPEDARSLFVLRSTPGLAAQFYVGTGPILAMDGSLSGLLWVVSGTSFYRVTPPPSETGNPIVQLLGNVGTSGFKTAPIIAVGDFQTVVVVTPNAWVADNATGAFSQITDPNFPGASSVCYLDGFFVFTAPNLGTTGSKVFCSNPLDAHTYQALNFAYTQPNQVNLCIEHNGLIWFLGEDKLEAWYNAGTLNFPFAPQPGAVVNYGCCPTTAAICDNAIFFLSYLGVVFRLDGTAVTRVSDYAMEEWIRDNVYYQNTDACAYMQQGHWFYCLTFQNTVQQLRTYVYDCGSKKWHERASNGLGTVWAGRSVSNEQANLRVGSRFDGAIFSLIPTVRADSSFPPLTRQATFPPIGNGLVRAFMSRFELDMSTTIDTTGIALEISDDGGVNYRTRADFVTSGGQSASRVYWNRLGSYQKPRVMRLTLSDRCVIYSAAADIVEGAS